jgi:hypothetical protein
MARRRAKPAPAGDQHELDFTRPPTPTKPARAPIDIDEAARLAIARRTKRAGTGDKVRLTLTIFLTRKQAERLSARAIRAEEPGGGRGRDPRGRGMMPPRAQLMRTALGFLRLDTQPEPMPPPALLALHRWLVGERS